MIPTTERKLSPEEKSRPFLVNGVVIPLGTFLFLNEGISPVEKRELLNMSPGEVQVFGGGAFATFQIERID